MASKVEFHRLLYNTAQKLSQEETDSLIFIEELPVAFKGKVPFTVLEQMVLQGTISASKPEKLVEVLKGINRVDLAKEAKDFSRTTKRNKKNRQSSEDEQVLHVAITANSEVALVQINILLAQLDRLTETMSEASQGSGRERVIDLVCRAKKQIESAEQLLKTLHCNTHSPSSNEEVHPLARAHSMDCTGPGDIFTQPQKPIQETFSRTESTRDEEILYEELDDIRMAVLPTQVAVTDEKKQSRPKPPLKPKPKVRLSTIPRDAETEWKTKTRMQSPALQQPKKQPILLPVARLRLKQTTQDSTQSTRQPTNRYSNNGAYTRAEVDDAIYEDLNGSSDYTGTGTGDSGSGDAVKPNARTQLEASKGCYKSARPGYYKSLHKETVEPEAVYEVLKAPIYESMHAVSPEIGTCEHYNHAS